MSKHVALLTVHGATDVPKMDTFGWADPYVKVKGVTDGTVYLKTAAKAKEKNPVWEQQCTVREEFVRLKLYDKDMTSDDLIGEVRIDCRERLDHNPFPVVAKDGKTVGETRIIVSLVVQDGSVMYVPQPNGMVRMNPYYAGETSVGPQYKNHDLLPVPSTLAQVDQFTPLSEVVPQLQPGSQHATTLETASEIFMKYEVPMGLVQRLDILGRFQAIDVIVDDSGSMSCGTDMRHPETGGGLTRWHEVFWRLLQMMEVLACAPVLPPIYVHYLNRKTELVLQRADGEGAGQFTARVRQILAAAWESGPSGTTPVIRPLTESFARFQGKPTIRYFYGDGVPNEPSSKVVRLVADRKDPWNNPFTFFSCTNDDECTEWMKECEEAAAACAEYDDFKDEAAEIVHDQGYTFPFTRGLYLLCSAVGAMFPEDLDAMDEGVPLTKASLDSILGYVTAPEQYTAYFSSMLQACEQQQRRKPNTRDPVERVKFASLPRWKQEMELFMTAASSNDIPAVREYRQQLVAAVKTKSR